MASHVALFGNKLAEPARRQPQTSPDIATLAVRSECLGCHYQLSELEMDRNTAYGRASSVIVEALSPKVRSINEDISPQ